MNLSSRTRAELILLLLTVGWGSTFALTKFVFEDSSVFVYLFLRFSLAAVFFAVLFGKRLKQLSFSSFVAGGILGFLLFVGFVLQTAGLQWTTASKSAFITGLMVVATPFFQFFLQKRLPHRGNIIAIFFVIVGLYLLTSPEGTGLNYGDVLTLGCALSFGLYIVLLDSYSRTHSPIHLTFVQFVIVAALSIPLMFFEERRLHCTTMFGVLLFYLVAVPTVAALYLQAKYQKDTTPTRSAVIFSLEPFLASLFAFVLLGEQLGTIGIVGGILIVTGILISELAGQTAKDAEYPKPQPFFDAGHITKSKQKST